ncbi:FCS-Like Zinc finger 1-like [Phragmites australis]|uniref:FCS-Like Zinc finger 1-like n=1 Tax=Phragmites australis TaxID=29695 RepID=UPI002D76F1CC|nr:FCS-Like Zinc finger 1-like [Phragmites australis]
MAASVACAGFFFDAEPVRYPSLPALDACALCTKPLARDSDIFMYRGDTPFCSEECRYEQMQLDAIRARQAARSAGRRQQYSQRTEAPRGHQEPRKVSVVTS